MSFTWKRPEGRLMSPEDMMRVIVRVADELGMPDRRGAAIIAGITVAQESDWWRPGNDADPCFNANPGAYPHDSMGDDGRSVGPYQQQTSGPPPATQWGWGGRYGEPDGTRKRMDPYESTILFLTSLKRYPYRAGNAQEANDWAQKVQGSGVPDAYAKHWGYVNALYDSVTGGAPTPTLPARPQFAELNFMAGGGRSNRTRPPINWLFHTEEGNSSAEQLARYCDGSHDVSYHYTCRDRIVCDVVDTDYASWSVLDANAYTVNFCFAGSRAGWSRDEWLAREGDIEIGCWLAVQDARKYGFPTDVIAPPYGDPRPGISDHKYVTQALHIGTHTDCGPNFPWDVVTTYVQKYDGTTGGDDLMGANIDDLNWLTSEMRKQQVSTSIYRDDDEPGANLLDKLKALDGSTDETTVERQAQMGDPDSLDKVRRLARGEGPGARDQWAVDRAKAVLAYIEAT